MHPFTELDNTEAHAADHALNDVAVMAEQPSWLLGVVAMIAMKGASLPHGAGAATASATLDLNKGGSQALAKSCASNPLFFDPQSPSHWVSLGSFVKGFGSPLAGLRLSLGPPASDNFRGLVVDTLALFDLGPRVVVAFPSSNPLPITGGVFTMVRQVFSPFFRRAVRFLHSIIPYDTPGMSYRNNRRISK